MYSGKYPARIKSVSYDKKNGLVLVSNDNTRLQLTPNEVSRIVNETSAQCLPKIGDDISIWEDMYWTIL